jgi:hypothetical protein
VEVHELTVAQYAEIALVGRVHASVGRPVRVGTAEGLDLHGRLADAGSDWLSVEEDAGTSFVPLAGVAMIVGLADSSLPDAARPLAARLSLRAVLRGLAAEEQACVLHLRGGRTLRGVPARVGADFVELALPESVDPVAVPLAALGVVRPSGGRP